MTEVILIPELENNAWPVEFSNAWANILVSSLGNTVFALYFNNIYPEATIIEDNNYLELPDAYISIRPNGEIYEIYVNVTHRRQGVGAMMCAWTRTNFINRGIIVSAPASMTDDAKALYNYLSLVYNEPYIDPSPVPLWDIYMDYGGRDIKDIEQQYN